MSSKQTVKFNVGGQKFEVSRSLLSMHPNTMLARCADEKWHEDPDSEIFIDRNGARFGICLDYLRDGEVVLPLITPKEAVLADLNYYGIENVHPSSITYSKQDDLAGKCVVRLLNDMDKSICVQIATRYIYESFISQHVSSYRLCYNEIKSTRDFDSIRKATLKYRKDLENFLVKFGIAIYKAGESYIDVGEMAFN